MRTHYHLSETTKEKIRIAHLGKKLSEEHKRKIGETNKIVLKGKHCSIKTEFKEGSLNSKYWLGKKGKNNPNWKGGRTLDISNGYVVRHITDHPLHKTQILEHRLVIEKQIGRYLHRWEVVHHINGIRNDNRIENLQLLTNSEHMKLHRKEYGD